MSCHGWGENEQTRLGGGVVSVPACYVCGGNSAAAVRTTFLGNELIDRRGCLLLIDRRGFVLTTHVISSNAQPQAERYAALHRPFILNDLSMQVSRQEKTKDVA